MAYILQLTNREFNDLAWMADRWAAPSRLYESLTPTEETEDSVIYTVSEPDAWEINELAEDPDDGFVCLNWSSSLGETIRAFLDSIV